MLRPSFVGMYNRIEANVKKEVLTLSKNGELQGIFDNFKEAVKLTYNLILLIIWNGGRI